MEENYSIKNTTDLKFSANIAVNSSKIIVKKRASYAQSLFLLLSLIVMFLLGTNMNGQTTLFSSGFETGNSTFTSSSTLGTITQPFTGNTNSGTKSGQIASPSGNTYSGSIITPSIDFVNGRWYTITIWANVSQWQGILKIAKSNTATNTAMSGAPVGDQLLWSSSNNVTSNSYNQYSVTFKATVTESKFVGFYMSTTSSGNAKTGIMNIDDISIVENTNPQPEYYCSAGGNSTATSYISNVNLNTSINQNSTAWGGYRNYYPTVSTNLIQSNTYTISIKVSNNSTTKKNISAWIDWNNNGVFDVATETVLSTTSTIASNQTVTLTNSFTVPAGAVVNSTVLRVELAFDSQGAATPCNTNSLTDVQDYKINITSGASCVSPTAQPTALSLTPTSTSIGGLFTLASPTADNYLVVVNTSGVIPVPVNGTTYTVGSTALGGSNIVVDTDGNNTFTANGLSASTLYYIYVFSFNSNCTGGPLYRTISPLIGNISTLVPSYCAPTGNLNCSLSDFISNVSFNTLNNPSTCSAGAYTNYSATGTQTTTVLKGSSYTFSLSVGAGTGYHGAGVWIDLNQNGSFSDAGEFFLVSNTINPSTTTTITIPIPAGAITGTTRMRVRYAYSTTVTSGAGMSCSMSGTYGETEDYTINITTPPACVTPTAQPTTLNLTPGGTSISGTFTYANPVADSYLLIMNTTGSVPTAPVNGTTYSIGGTVGAGNIVINNQNDNSFVATGLTPNTRYYFFVYSFNSACLGAPFYNTTSPLTGNVLTTGFSFCSATSNTSTRYIESVQTVGNLTNMTNLNTGRSIPGYADYTTTHPATTQIPGGGINLDITLATSRQYLKAWVDWNNDGTLTDSGTELVYTSSGVLSIATSFGFVVPLGTAPGNYRLRIRSFEASQTFSPCGNLATGETEDYTITVVPDCPAIISSVTDSSRCETGIVSLSAIASGSPTQYRWYNALTGGSLIGTSTTGNWNTPSISITTNYFVTAFNGTCESLIRTKVIATINGSSIISMTPSIPEVCGEGNIVTITASGDNMVDNLINENFQGGLGTLTSVIIGDAGDVSTQWQSKTSTFVPTLSVWKPAISSRSINDKFAFCTSDKNLLVNTSLESANFNTIPYSNLTLTFRQYYSYYGIPLDFAYVEVSTNNGVAWTAVKTYVEDRAIATNFETVTIDLTPYINNANFKIRFRYNAQFCDGWAIDDVRLFGTKLMNTTFSWGAGSVDAYVDSTCETPYTNQLVSTVYIKPTSTQLSSTSWSFTATATLSNGCPVSKDVTIYNKTKQWLGTNSNWSDSNNWKPSGVPDITNCVFIPNNSIISGSDYNAFAKNLTVKSGGNLELQTTNNITVADWVNVNTGGIFNVRNNSSLVQINNTTNTGIVNVERNSTPIKKLDYTYWSTPVTPFTLGQFFTANSYMYSWIPTVAMSSGNWQPESNATVMTPGKGYIIRTPWGHTENTIYTARFINGTPNNGDITTPISKGTLTGVVDDNAENDEWNLIGNPYPSALDAAAFLNLPANVPVIDGTLYLWTHNSQPNAATIDPFYGDYVLNYTESDYAAWNKTGGVGTAGTVAGGLGTNAGTGNTPTGYIASGQSFFVKAANIMTNGTNANATFNNSMRVGVEGKNGDFFKLTKNNKEEAIPKTVTDIERHRIWINLTNNSGAFSQTLVGYVAGATQELDRSFDGESLGGNDVTFYSIIPEAELTIQGRALPFNENDQVTLGYNSEISGELSIRIDHIDGLFDAQNIYLEDKELGVIHNLKENPYVFKTEKGTFNDRFYLRFTDKTLGTDTFYLSKSDQVNVVVNQNVTVQSSNQLIKNIVVYDLAGRKIDSYKKVNALKYTLSHLNKTTAGLIVKITLENDTVVSKKIIY
ncbi:GEVED domain-containing protein [Flavobacterium sp. LS2P90]|uniref:GEVED domain-containing protein n=1 Tax=Flavobacterium xylosi TaxID=3230415 RepID=A0ABW6HY11_9FLAO